MTYFKYAVQPFGALVLVTEKLGDATLQARFADVEFEPNSSQIIAKQQGYLAKIASMINAKKDFSVLVCVVVTEQDFLARPNPPNLTDKKKLTWDAASQDLAQERQNLIHDSLIKDYGLDTSQVQACQPRLGKGKPRAEMGI